MKRWVFIVVFLVPTLVYSAGWLHEQVQPESRDEGDSPVFIDVSCPPLSPGVWTTVISSDTIRRSMFIQSDYQVQPPVCLGTAVALQTAPACNSSFAGAIIGTATVTSFISYTKNAWTCASATSVTGILHGVIGRDKRDYGDVGASGLQ